MSNHGYYTSLSQSLTYTLIALTQNVHGTLFTLGDTTWYRVFDQWICIIFLFCLQGYCTEIQSYTHTPWLSTLIIFYLTPNQYNAQIKTHVPPASLIIIKPLHVTPYENLHLHTHIYWLAIKLFVLVFLRNKLTAMYRSCALFILMSDLTSGSSEVSFNASSAAFIPRRQASWSDSAVSKQLWISSKRPRMSVSIPSLSCSKQWRSLTLVAQYSPNG